MDILNIFHIWYQLAYWHLSPYIIIQDESWKLSYKLDDIRSESASFTGHDRQIYTVEGANHNIWREISVELLTKEVWEPSTRRFSSSDQAVFIVTSPSSLRSFLGPPRYGSAV
jgi:hypothetical protein